MDCTCQDHRPGSWHSDHGCDCHKHEHPTFTLVVTKVMEKDPGFGVAYISGSFMEKMGLKDNDPVELLDAPGCVVQAKTHPNPWIETRMMALDKQTLETRGLQLFSQIRLRKASCCEAGTVILQVPDGVALTRRNIRALLEKASGVVLSGRDHLSMTLPKGEEVRFTVLKTDPEEVCRLTASTRVELVDSKGEEYVPGEDTTFKDVGGLGEAVRKVREVVQLPLRHPAIFERLGIDPPRGVLLHGPSGTGKTLIARAVAGETGCYFKSIMGTEIMDKHYGESEAKLRAAFEDAEKKAPSIIFIDEIDALAPRRDTAEGEVERRVTAQLLALMDGLQDRGRVMVLAATNLPNVLDSALRRPGRFDREVLIPVPDKKGRREILEIHTRLMPLTGVDLDDLADKLHGFVGADIRALCREAAYKALRRTLPGLEDTEQELTPDFIESITVEPIDFENAFKEMKPSAGRTFEVDLHGSGWDRIAGHTAEVEFIKEMVLWPLQNLTYLSNLGVTNLDGLLITGPSGVGKTLMARSLARESGFNVIEIRGPELISKYMGESERNIREVFGQARQMAPTVLILDGVDAMTSSGGSGSDTSKVIGRVVNQMVMEMDAITTKRPILVVAVANRAEEIPAALRASGKFGTELKLRPPDAEDRMALLRMYLSRDGVKFHGDLDAAVPESEGLTGGDIKEACRRAVLAAARCLMESGSADGCHVEISETDLLKALDRFKPGLDLRRAPGSRE